MSGVHASCVEQFHSQQSDIHTQFPMLDYGQAGLLAFYRNSHA